MDLPLGPTYGALFIGLSVSSILFGVTNIQTLAYFQRYPRDIPWNKFAVAVLWILDATHLALCVYMVYFYLVIHYANPEMLLNIVWSFKAQIMLDVRLARAVTDLPHRLYTIRLWKLTAIDDQVMPLSTRNDIDISASPDVVASSHGRRQLARKILPVSVTVLVLLGYVLCYEVNKLERWVQLLEAKWVTYFALGAASVIDLVVASSLCYFLARCRTGSQNMDSTITVLIVYTLNTGMITSICSLTAIAMMAVFPTTFIMIAIEFSLTKLYINSFMAMFNARSTLRNHDTPSVDIEYKDLPLTPSLTAPNAVWDVGPHTPHTSLAVLEVDLGNDLHSLCWPPAPDTSSVYVSTDQDGDPAYPAVSMPVSPRSWRKPPPEVDAVSGSRCERGVYRGTLMDALAEERSGVWFV
ncbi:hypothetical protein B0H21DRAFT_753135 [Amylocystis lapponica]|nr:hypothetical protein B0H21DRAFT_753135 [Amylocystis lapponica]